jgi:hypothetical protein
VVIDDLLTRAAVPSDETDDMLTAAAATARRGLQACAAACSSEPHAASADHGFERLAIGCRLVDQKYLRGVLAAALTSGGEVVAAPVASYPALASDDM